MSKFDELMIEVDISAEIYGTINKLMKEAYNRGVSDAQMAALDVHPSCEAQDAIIRGVEKAIVVLYAK